MTIFSMNATGVFGPIFPHPLGGNAARLEVQP